MNSEVQKKPVSKLKRPFILAGVLLGVGLSVWYLYSNLGSNKPIPDPIWTRFVNVALILFCSIYVMYLVRRGVEFLLRNFRRG